MLALNIGFVVTHPFERSRGGIHELEKSGVSFLLKSWIVKKKVIYDQPSITCGNHHKIKTGTVHDFVIWHPSPVPKRQLTSHRFAGGESNIVTAMI